jgi:recombination protein RecA
MARKKKEDTYLEDLAKDFGAKMLIDIGTSQYFIDTGNLALNYICSGKFIKGGIPGGRITEVYGPPAGGKSLLGMTVLGSTQRMRGISVLLDCERASNPIFAENAAHVDVSKLVVTEPISIEQVTTKITNLTKKIREHYGNDVPICFLWDSIGVTPTEREWKETDLPENYTKEQMKATTGSLEKPGERAKAAGNALRKLNPFLNEQNATLLIINQIRQKIGVLFGSDETVAGGGKALEFYCSCRLRTSAHAKIEAKEDSNKTSKHTKKSLGVNLSFRNMKSRCFMPFLNTSQVQLYFDRGINPLGGLLSVLMAAGRVQKASKGNYKVLEPWCAGNDIKFKSSEDRNDVPVELVRACPSVIDAESEDEVVDYLNIYGEAIELSTSGNTEDVPTSDDLEDNAPIEDMFAEEE